MDPSQAYFIPVMEYLEGNHEVKLLTDESHSFWFLSVNGKAVQCVGCQHGLDLFDSCVDRVRQERLVN